MTTKRNEHWRAFGKEWFADHQRILLWLLNAPLIGRWFKWCLCIRACDIGHRREILEIQPHCYTVAGEHPDTLTTDFRTHWKYSKRLYYAFRPMWWAMHAWDSVADAWLPRWSFGFATLTAYPDPHPESTTFDGIVSRNASNETWATIIASAGTESSDTGSIFGSMCHITSGGSTDGWNFLTRYICLFDTSALGAFSVSGASLNLYGAIKADNLSITPDINVYSATTVSNTSVSNSDFEGFGSSALSSTVDYTSWSTIAYNTFELNGTGIAAIQTTGITKFGTRNANYDVSGTPPSWSASVSSYVQGYFADNTGTSNDPKLVVFYVVLNGIRQPNRMRPAPFVPGIAR